MTIAFKIDFRGHKELDRALRDLNPAAHRTAIRGALNKRANAIKKRIVANLNAKGGTGALARAFRAEKASAIPARNPAIFQGRAIAFPTRAAVGIPAKAPGYYPIHVELGTSKMPARPYIRPAVDDHRAEDHAALARDIGKGLERAWARLAARRAAKGK